MDLDEWEVIPSTKPYRRHVSSKELLSFLSPTLLVETDYFKCPTPGRSPSPSPTEQQHEEEGGGGAKEEEEEEADPKLFKDLNISTEFAKDTDATTPALASPVNWLEPDPMVFSQGSIVYEKEKEEEMTMDRKKETVMEVEKDCAGFNLWGLRVNGIGAICSFGVATAATLCVFALGTASASVSATGHVRPSPNIQFQIFSDDKRIKDVVQRATGLNHAMSAARGIPIPTAQISFGGHYEGF